MLISPYGEISSRPACRSGRFCTAVMVSAGSGVCARTAAAASAITDGNQKRMAPQNMGGALRRATPCGRAGGNQLCLAWPRAHSRAADSPPRRAARASDLGAPCHVENAAGAELIPLPGRQYLYLGRASATASPCLATQGSTGGYCSQSCSGQGGSCPSGMSCTQLAVNQQYLDTMKARCRGSLPAIVRPARIDLVLRPLALR